MKNPHAIELGRLGGQARVLSSTPQQRRRWARLGGLARAKRHSKDELRDWAKLGGRPPKKGKRDAS